MKFTSLQAESGKSVPQEDQLKACTVGSKIYASVSFMNVGVIDKKMTKDDRK